MHLGDTNEAIIILNNLKNNGGIEGVTTQFLLILNRNLSNILDLDNIQLNILEETDLCTVEGL
jgi:hypothetical protein